MDSPLHRYLPSRIETELENVCSLALLHLTRSCLALLRYVTISRANFATTLVISLLLYFCFIPFRVALTSRDIKWTPSGRHGIYARAHSFIVFLFNTDDALLGTRQLFHLGAKSVLMNSFLDGPTVLLPSRTLKWYSNNLASPSNNTLDLFHLHNEKLHFDYTLRYLTTAHNPDVRKNVRRLLARRSKEVTAEAFEEIQYANARFHSSYEDWQSFAVFNAVLRLAAASTNRTLVGTALCRDDQFFEVAVAISQWPVFLGSIIQVVPSVVRPVLGGAIRLILERCLYSKLRAKLTPLINRYLTEATKTQGDRNALEDNLIAWYINEAQRTHPGRLPSHDDILAVLISLEFGGLLTTTIMATQTLYNILAHPEAEALIISLREEAQDLENCSDRMTYTYVESLTLLNSVVRETMRLHPLDSILHPRIVVNQIVTSDGETLAPGTKVGLDIMDAQSNPLVYANAEQFIPDCWVGGSTASSFSTDYLPFGYGVQACPGRWLATIQIKLILARLLLDFDFQPMTSAPTPFYVGTMRVPSVSCKVMAKKRRPNV